MTGGMNNGPRLDALLRQVAQGAPPHKKAKVRTFDDVLENLCVFFKFTWSMINMTLLEVVLICFFRQNGIRHVLVTCKVTLRY